MRITPEDEKRRGVGIGIGFFAKQLEGLSGNLAGVFRDRSCDRQSVHIRLMLFPSAEGVAQRFAEEGKKRSQQQQQRERRPVAEGADLPAFAVAGERGLGKALDEPECLQTSAAR